MSYNAAATIESTLQSVLGQTYPNIEYILIDGNSTDETIDIINRYRDRIARIVSEPDRGLYDAMNKGIALANGDIVGLLNADDVYANSDIVHNVVQMMLHEQLDAVYGDVEYFDARDISKTLRRYHSSFFRPSRIGFGLIPAHPTLFLRREVYQKYGLFDPSYRVAGDHDFVARIFKPGKIRYRHVSRVFVRMRLGGVSTRSWISSFKHNAEVIQACRNNGITSNWPMILCKYPIKALGLVFK